MNILMTIVNYFFTFFAFLNSWSGLIGVILIPVLIYFHFRFTERRARDKEDFEKIFKYVYRLRRWCLLSESAFKNKLVYKDCATYGVGKKERNILRTELIEIKEEYDFLKIIAFRFDKSSDLCHMLELVVAELWAVWKHNEAAYSSDTAPKLTTFPPTQRRKFATDYLGWLGDIGAVCNVINLDLLDTQDKILPKRKKKLNRCERFEYLYERHKDIRHVKMEEFRQKYGFEWYKEG